MSLAQQTAATAAATVDVARIGKPCYAEICGPTGTPVWSGSFGASPPVASTAAGVASVSKSIYACHASHVQTLTATDWPYLVMTSGQDTANGATCNQDNIQTVDVCLTTLMGSGNPAHIGLFSYDSRHWQYHADKVATTSLAGLTRSQITSLYQTTFGLASGDISMSSATIAGGVIAKPTTLRSIAQQIMTGTGGCAGIKALLDSDSWAPVPASAYFGPGLVYASPAPSDEPWYYKWGFWIEPGGDYYWMAGSFGTALWIKKDWSMYGLVFRVQDQSGGEIGIDSIRTAQAIRTAFLNTSSRPRNSRGFGLGWNPWVD